MKKKISVSCGVCGGHNIGWTNTTNGKRHEPIMVCIDCEEKNKEQSSNSLQGFLNNMGKLLSKEMRKDLE